MEAMQPRICIQPQSRRSPRYYITIIIRAPSRVFQLQDSQHSFQDCMDYILPGLHRKHSTKPSPRQHNCSLHHCGFSLFIGKSSFLSFWYFLANLIIRIWFGLGWAVVACGLDFYYYTDTTIHTILLIAFSDHHGDGYIISCFMGLSDF